MDIGSLIAKIGGDVTPLQQAVKQAQVEMQKADEALATSANKFNDSIKKAASSLQSFGRSASVYLTLPILAAGGFAIKMASDFNESLNKVEVAFKDSSGEVKKWAKTTLKSFGIAEGSALDMAALYGDMSTSMGLNTKQAAKLSTSLVGLAGDLASFKNIGIEQASTALAGIFTGETESLKRLGIVMTEENLKMFALSKGIQQNIKDMTQAEKVQLRYAYVMEMTTNSHGDFARTQGGAANQMRIFKESLKELGVTFGQVILPLFTSIVIKINGWLQAFKNLSPITQKFIIILAGIAAALGPIAIGLSAILKVLPLIAAGGRLIASSWGPVAAILAAVAGGFFMVKKWGEDAAQSVEDIGNIYAKWPTAKVEKQLAEEKENLKILQETSGWYDTAKAKLLKYLNVSRTGDAIGSTERQIKYLERALEIQKQQADAAKAFQDDLKNLGGIDLSALTGGKESLDDMKSWMEYMKAIAPTMKEFQGFNLWNSGGAIKPIELSGLPTGMEVFKELSKEVITQTNYWETFGDTVSLVTASIASNMRGPLEEVKMVLVDIGAEMQKLATESVINLATSFGNLLSGGSAKDAMKSFLLMVADWAINLGSLMIAAGIAASSFWKSLMEGPAGAGAAIGIGAALVAAGALVKGAMAPPGAKRSAGASRSSGGSDGEGIDLMGTRRLQQFTVLVTGTLTGKGTDLLATINNENTREGL